MQGYHSITKPDWANTQHSTSLEQPSEDARLLVIRHPHYFYVYFLSKCFTEFKGDITIHLYAQYTHIMPDKKDDVLKYYSLPK